MYLLNVDAILVFNSGQSNAQEEYAMKRDREVMMTAFDMFIISLN